MLEKVIVSACLLGETYRYDAKSCPNKEVIEFLKDKVVFAICPEVMGGLPTPRNSCERIGDCVISNQQEDYTSAYQKGAKEVLELVKSENITTAILKSKSPSCGFGEIYDGTFTQKIIQGNGICTELLLNNGINVINSDNLAFNFKKVKKKAL